MAIRRFVLIALTASFSAPAFADRGIEGTGSASPAKEAIQAAFAKLKQNPKNRSTAMIAQEDESSTEAGRVQVAQNAVVAIFPHDKPVAMILPGVNPAAAKEAFINRHSGALQILTVDLDTLWSGAAK